MFVFRETASLRQYLQERRGAGNTIGFVPTMGALHEGHLSLVDTSLAQTDCTVVSIFVNPTQFNEAKDLEKYPRNVPQDVMELQKRACHAVFVPEVEEIYPPELDTHLDIDFAGLDLKMEGKHRPGHFNGVARVVKRLLDLVEPNTLFMGQKDFQQLAIVRHMIKALEMDVEVVMCPTKREAHGLAMSSRNLLLPEDVRRRASIIYETLVRIKSLLGKKPIDELEKTAMQELKRPDFEPEYFEIVDGTDLHPITDANDSEYVVACCAVRVAGVRLIDNMVLKLSGNQPA
jgi:pantoate--beta-alanine ligase